MKIFLRAKNWQIFLFAFALPFGLVVISAFASLMHIVEPLSVMRVIFPIMLLFILFQLCWLWSVGVLLQKRLPKDVARQTVIFKISLLFPCFFAALVFSVFAIEPASLRIVETNLALFGTTAILTAFCLFYANMFVARALKEVEMGVRVPIVSCVSNFVLIINLPLGIWDIQKEINKLV